MFAALRVRDWSGILCERNRIWGRGMGFGNLEEIFERGEDEASKDIAESPTRSGTPKKVEN